MHCVLNLRFRCKFCKNGFFNTFFPLSIHAILKLAPVLLQKIGKNVFGGQFLQFCCKNENGRNPHFSFYVLIRTVLPFNEKKIGTNLCSVFLAILLKCIDWVIKGYSAWYNMLQRKNFFFLSTLGCVRFLSKGPKQPYLSALWHQNKHSDPHYLLLLYQCTKFYLQSTLSYFTKESKAKAIWKDLWVSHKPSRALFQVFNNRSEKKVFKKISCPGQSFY